eukprot:9534476-Heterocapsa_arctica.AAC.1
MNATSAKRKQCPAADSPAEDVQVLLEAVGDVGLLFVSRSTRVDKSPCTIRPNSPLTRCSMSTRAHAPGAHAAF